MGGQSKKAKIAKSASSKNMAKASSKKNTIKKPVKKFIKADFPISSGYSETNLPPKPQYAKTHIPMSVREMPRQNIVVFTYEQDDEEYGNFLQSEKDRKQQEKQNKLDAKLQQKQEDDELADLFGSMDIDDNNHMRNGGKKSKRRKTKKNRK
jgi:hypothetical protein